MAVFRVVRPGYPDAAEPAAQDNAELAEAIGRFMEEAGARELVQRVRQAEERVALGAPGIRTVVARSTVTETPRGPTYVIAVAGLVIAAVVVWAFDANQALPAALKLADNVNAFALFYVAAQGIERLLEPFTFLIHSNDQNVSEASTRKGLAATAETEDVAKAHAAAAADREATAKRTKNERAILFWAAATIVGVAVSAVFGLQFLGTILDDSSIGRIPRVVDVLATGLVIGGGSKALHDLISRISKPKEDNESETG